MGHSAGAHMAMHLRIIRAERPVSGVVACQEFMKPVWFVNYLSMRMSDYQLTRQIVGIV